MICLFLVKITSWRYYSIFFYFVIALLITSHEMNYKIIGMLFILLHVLYVCVDILYVHHIPTEMRCIAFLQAWSWNDQYNNKKLDTQFCFNFSINEIQKKKKKINVMAIAWNVDDWNCHIKAAAAVAATTHCIPGCCNSRNIINPYVNNTKKNARNKWR